MSTRFLKEERLFPYEGAAGMLRLAVASPIDEETLRRLLPPYRVILHDDDVNSMDHVVRSLVSAVPSLTEEEATTMMPGIRRGLEMDRTRRYYGASC